LTRIPKGTAAPKFSGVKSTQIYADKNSQNGTLDDLEKAGPKKLLNGQLPNRELQTV